ncbi:immunity 49 family protein [Photobacterium kasasachensis]|uniref:immunity 49 family protein n=1 Tax=Photobacterium kasasachensis TaxID=2910240 RepID=UPI003D12C3EB
MDRKVETHAKASNIMIEKVLEDQTSIWSDIFSKLKTNGGICLPSNLDDGIEAASVALVGRKQRSDVIRYLCIAKDCAVAHFIREQLSTGCEFEVILDGESYYLEGKQGHSYLHFQFWFEAFCLTVMLRDWDKMHELLSYDESMFDTANVQSDKFDRALFALIKGMFKKGSNMQALMQDAVTASESRFIDEHRQPWAYSLLLPLLEIVSYILTTDVEEQYQEAMYKACQSHKDIWQSKDASNSKGWLSIPLTAMAVLAYEYRQYELGFDTDYIPHWIVVGDYK